jgi:hypothetical protein
MAYNSDRKGFETKDGGLIRVNGSGDKVRIDVYDGDERTSNHSRDSIHYDSNTGSGRIDSHNADKSEKSSTDTSCYLTSACMKHYLGNFDDNCYELKVLRWFRDKFVSQEDIEHYYQTAPIIVEAIDNIPENNVIYNDIYQNVVKICILAIEKKDYELAYKTYRNSILILEERFARKEIQKRLVKIFKSCNSENHTN